MNKIHFTAYKSPDKESIFTRDKYFRVWIKRNTQVQFKSKTKMIIWLRESSKFFTFKMYQFVGVYSSVQKLYWDNWLYFSIADNKNNERFLAAKKIENQFIQISENLNRAIIEAKYDTGINFVLSRFENSKLLLDNNCKIMLDQIPRSNYATQYKLKTHLSELQLWQNQISKFGTVKTAGIVFEEMTENVPELKIVV